MILISDVGSTSGDWAILDQKKLVRQFKTVGFNPLSHHSTMLETFTHQLSDQTKQYQISEVYYFGTGVISLNSVEVIKSQLKALFPAADIKVNTDLIGAVRATCGNASGIVCILGTGSNACYFDGVKTEQHTPSLGFILGDEGSGCDLGKSLLRAYFYGILPPEIAASFQVHFDGRSDVLEQKSMLLEKLHNHAAPNQYLARFAAVAQEHHNHPIIENLVRGCMMNFFAFHVLPYSTDEKIHVVGSIGYTFQEIFNSIATAKGYQVSAFVQHPIEGLISYFQKQNRHDK